MWLDLIGVLGFNSPWEDETCGLGLVRVRLSREMSTHGIPFAHKVGALYVVRDLILSLDHMFSWCILLISECT